MTMAVAMMMVVVTAIMMMAVAVGMVVVAPVVVVAMTIVMVVPVTMTAVVAVVVIVVGVIRVRSWMGHCRRGKHYARRGSGRQQPATYHVAHENGLLELRA